MRSFVKEVTHLSKALDCRRTSSAEMRLDKPLSISAGRCAASWNQSGRMVWVGVGMASGFQGQQKTHTRLESVDFMFKVHRFGTLYFAVVNEVSMHRNLLI